MGVLHWCRKCEWIGEDEMADPLTCYCGEKVDTEEPRVPFEQRQERPITAQYLARIFSHARESR